MKPDVLVDTSIWIEYFNRPDSKQGGSLHTLLKNGRVIVAGLVLTELLRGARLEKEFKLIGGKINT